MRLNQNNEEILGKKVVFFASFFIPIFIMILIFIQRGIFPFGDESFLRTDLYHQYAPFFSEFKYKLSNGGSLFYTWNLGMGINFSALYAYYLASPLNWLIILVPQQFVIEFMTYMIVLKIGLSGLSFTYYLSKNGARKKSGVLFFGIFYALSGYIAAYSWNIMWLDCIILFPIVCLGLERLVNRGSGFLYSISLGLCILSNYYISIMICIFMVIYFAALLILKKRNNFKKIIVSAVQFSVFSLLAGGLSALVLLPEIYALRMTASGDFNFPSNFNSYFSIFDMIARHIGNVQVEIGLDHWPNIFCGVGVFIFFVLYLRNSKVEKKEKVVYISMIVFLLAGFSINILNYIWHGLHYPNSLPARQSFIYIFLVLYICARAYDKLKSNTTKDLGVAFTISMAFVLLAQKLVANEDFHFAVFYVAMVFICIYAFIIYLYIKNRFYAGNLYLAALAIVVVESSINMTVTSVTTVSRSDYTLDNHDVRRLLGGLPMNDFYRVDKVDRKTKDDGAWLNFKSVSLFSSTADASLSDLFKKLGNEASTNAYSITGQTPLLDMLFAVKYAIYTGESKNKNITFIDLAGKSYLYENKYVLPLGFMVDERFTDEWNINLGDPINVQNDLAAVYGVGDIFDQVATDNESSDVTFDVDYDGEYFAYVTNPNIDEVNFGYVDADSKKAFKNLKRHYLLELGSLEAGKQGRFVNVEGNDGSLDMRVFRVNYNSLKELYNILNKNTLQLTSISDDKIVGEVLVDKATTLFTSIPYDEGWSVYVDGKQTEKIKLTDAFLGIELTAGKHNVEFKFLGAGVIMGRIVSGISVVILLFLYIASNIINNIGVQGKRTVHKAADSKDSKAEDDESNTDITEHSTKEPDENKTSDSEEGEDFNDIGEIIDFDDTGEER